MKSEYEAISRQFKALCDPNRVWILNILKHGEQCACHLLEALSVGQPTLSHHMKILVESGVVNARKQGKWVYYSLADQGITDLIEYLNTLSSQEKRFICCEEDCHETSSTNKCCHD